MSNFSQEIQNFQRYGSYMYNFDNVGNFTFNSSSTNFNQVYLSMPIQNVIYDNDKIKTIYNVEFEEFVPQLTEELSITADDNIKEQLDNVVAENELLKSEIDTIISKNESSNIESEKLATKQVILELRKAIGQGRVDSDFSDTFPYTPIRKSQT